MARYKTKYGLLTGEDIQFKSLKATLNRLGCKPEEVLAYITTGNWKKLGLPSEVVLVNDGKGGHQEKPAVTIEVRQKAAAELMSYMYPKLKAIEHTGEVTAVTEQRLTVDEIKSILQDDPFLNAKEIVIDGQTRGEPTPTQETTGHPSATSRDAADSSEA